MDRTIKFLLGVIAASLLMLNLQLAGGSLVKDAQAQYGSQTITVKFLGTEFEGIASAIKGLKPLY